MTNEEIWQATLGELEVALSKANFTTWFKDTMILNFEEGIITIGVPNAFTKNWLENKYHKKIVEILRKIAGEIKTVQYKIGGVGKKTVGSPQEKLGEDFILPEKGSVGELNKRYTFETFVVGPSNRLAHAACLAVAKNPGQTYNPLFIYGGAGLGKTHLLQAVGHEAKKIHKNKKILYTTCEKFTNEFIHSIGTNKINNFKKTYREIDILLIDDIQFLGGKEQTQEEFFHTFNALHQADKQIVVSSDRPPKAISSLEARIVSRFEWGLIADISPPDLETRIAILQSYCKNKVNQFSVEVINFIAKNIQHNIRELEGATNRIAAYCELNNCSPTIEIAKNLIGESLVNSRRQAITAIEILEKVARFYNISTDSLLGPKRNKEFVLPRQIGAYLLREELNLSFPKIGEELGGRDHTTIMHACEKIVRESNQNKSLKNDISLIKEKIYSVY